jgi:hypothetical protein
MPVGGLIRLPRESMPIPAQHLSVYLVTVELAKLDFAAGLVGVHNVEGGATAERVPLVWSFLTWRICLSEQDLCQSLPYNWHQNF